MWERPDILAEPSTSSDATVYLALDNGEVILADSVHWVDTASEYHSSTGEYLGEFVQGGWTGYVGRTGDMVEKDDVGWHCTQYPNGADKGVRVNVLGWMNALKPVPTWHQ